MKVLVHYNPSGSEAYGIWWVDPDTGYLKDLYLAPDGPFAARGRVVVHEKTNPDVSWSEWFDELTTRAPYFESWVVYDSMGMTPEQMLNSLKPASPVE